MKIIIIFIYNMNSLKQKLAEKKLFQQELFQQKLAEKKLVQQKLAEKKLKNKNNQTNIKNTENNICNSSFFNNENNNVNIKINKLSKIKEKYCTINGKKKAFIDIAIEKNLPNIICELLFDKVNVNFLEIYIKIESIKNKKTVEKILEISKKYDKDFINYYNIIKTENIEPELISPRLYKKIIIHAIKKKDNNFLLRLLNTTKFSENIINNSISEIDNEGRTVLMYALDNEKCNLEMINFLIERLDVNAKDNKGKTALMHAIINNKSHEIITLLMRKVDVNAKDNEGRTALMHAIDTNSLEIINLLMRKVDVNAKDNEGRTALMYAIINNKSHEIITLLMRKVDVNAIDYDGKTALMHAIDTNSLEIINLLMTKVDLNAKDNEGRTALMYAIINQICSFEIINLLMTKVDVNAIDYDGKTALMHAIINQICSFEIINLLITNVDVNKEDNQGRTALMYAIYFNKSSDIITLLITNVDVNKEDNQGRTALIYAIINQICSFEIKNLLIEKSNIEELLKSYIENNKYELAILLIDYINKHSMNKNNEMLGRIIELISKKINISNQISLHKIIEKIIENPNIEELLKSCIKNDNYKLAILLIDVFPKGNKCNNKKNEMFGRIIEFIFEKKNYFFSNKQNLNSIIKKIIKISNIKNDIIKKCLLFAIEYSILDLIYIFEPYWNLLNIQEKAILNNIKSKSKNNNEKSSKSGSAAVSDF